MTANVYKTESIYIHACVGTVKHEYDLMLLSF